MAIYHLSLKTASRQSGGRAGEHAKYIARVGRYATEQSISQSEYQYLAREGQHTGRINELVHLEHQNMPSWAEDDPTRFWQAADKGERANGRLYTEVQYALPRELSLEQRQELAEDFAQKLLGDRHPYTLAVHNQIALDGAEQPHCHLMFSERRLDGRERDAAQFFKRANPQYPERGGAKKNRDWSRREKIEEVRQLWEKMANAALKRYGFDECIDRRSLEARGIDREPEPKLGPARTAQLKQGRHSDDGITAKVMELRDQCRQNQQQKKRHVPAQSDVHRLSAEHVYREVTHHVKRLEAQLEQAIERRNQLGYEHINSEDLAKAHAERMARELVGGERWASAEATLRSTAESLEEIKLQRNYLKEHKDAQGIAGLLPWNAVSLGAEAWTLERRYQKAQANYDAAREHYNLTLDWLERPHNQHRQQQLVADLMDQYKRRKQEHRQTLRYCKQLQTRLEQERLYALSLKCFGQATFPFRKNDQGRWMPAEPKQFINRFVAHHTRQPPHHVEQQQRERERTRQ